MQDRIVVARSPATILECWAPPAEAATTTIVDEHGEQVLGNALLATLGTLIAKTHANAKIALSVTAPHYSSRRFALHGRLGAVIRTQSRTPVRWIEQQPQRGWQCLRATVPVGSFSRRCIRFLMSRSAFGMLVSTLQQIGAFPSLRLPANYACIPTLRTSRCVFLGKLKAA